MSLSSAPRITEQNVNLGSPSGERKWEHHKGRPVNICPINSCISHTQKVTGILGALINICWMNQWSREWINESIKLLFIEPCFVGPCATYFVHTIALEFSKPCKKYYSPCWTDVRVEALLSYMPKVQKLLNDGWSSWTWAVHLLKLGPFSYRSSPDSPILDKRIEAQRDEMTSSGLSWSFVVELGLARSPVVLGAVRPFHMAAADPTPPSEVFPLTLKDPWPSHRGLCSH